MPPPREISKKTMLMTKMTSIYQRFTSSNNTASPAPFMPESSKSEVKLEETETRGTPPNSEPTSQPELASPEMLPSLFPNFSVPDDHSRCDIQRTENNNASLIVF